MLLPGVLFPCLLWFAHGHGVEWFIEEEKLLYKEPQDPLGVVDVFQTLTEEQLEKYFSKPTADGRLSSLVQDLKDFEVLTYVDVKLVGFEGDGLDSVYLLEEDFQRYFQSIHTSSHVPVIHPFLRSFRAGHNVSSYQTNYLNFKTKVFYNVMHAPKKMAIQISNVLSSTLSIQNNKYNNNNNDDAAAATNSTTTDPRRMALNSSSTDKGRRQSPNGLVKYSDVDDIVREDFLERGLSFTLYIINAKIPDHIQKYKYTRRDLTGTTASYFASKECGAGLKKGNEVERYAWIDLNAGPIEYGPASNGEGYAYQLPAPRRYDPTRLDATAAAAEFMADVVAAVQSSSELLFDRPMMRYPVYHRSVRVTVYHIKEDPADIASSFNFDALKSTVEGMYLMRGQQVQLSLVTLSYHACEFCVNAFVNSLRTHTSTVLVHELRAQTHNYIDSKELKYWLERFHVNSADADAAGERLRQARYSGYADYAIVDDEDYSARVFVFDMMTPDVLLLDRFHQAIAFDNMVVAVQSRAGQILVDYKCEGSSMTINTRDATIAVLSGLLDTIFGVPPGFLLWDDIDREPRKAFMWETDRSPSSPFVGKDSHKGMQLSFVHHHAATRNVIYSRLHAALEEITEVLTHFDMYDRTIDEALTDKDALAFVRRWNVLRFKIEKAATYLSLHQYNTSLYYTYALQHDIQALHELCHGAAANVHSYYDCQHRTRHVSALDLFLFCNVCVSILFSLRYLFVRLFFPSSSKVKVI